MKTDHELEAALRRVLTSTDTNNAAMQRMVARLEALPPQKGAFAWWPAALLDWNFTPAWPRLAALAGAAVLGISIGLSNVGTRIAADLDLVRMARADDTSINAFETDAGLRP
jgi:hypothetical protein